MPIADWYQRMAESVGGDRLRRRLLVVEPGRITDCPPGWEVIEAATPMPLPCADRAVHLVVADGLFRGRDRVVQRIMAKELTRIAERVVVIADRRNFPITTELCSLFPQGSRVSVLPMITTRRPHKLVAHVRSPLLSGRRAPHRSRIKP